MHKQKASKKCLYIVLAVIVVLGVGGLLIWGLQKSDTDSREPIGATASCGDVFQCIDKLDPSSSLEEMNDLIGSEAELVKETNDSKTYKWTLADDTTIEARFTTYDSAVSDESKTFVTFNINYPENLVAHDADLSHWDEIKTRMNNEDGITYDQIVELVGGTDGTIVEKSQGSKKYQWFNSDGGYLNASFDDETSKCTFATGRF